MTINKRIQQIIDKLYDGRQNAFAATMGVTPSVINGIIGKRQSKPSFEVLERICALENLSTEWLLKGTGEMLKHNTKENTQLPIAAITQKRISSDDGIPMVHETAVGGLNGTHLNVRESDILGRYNIPKFKNTNADFLIEVRGDSMTPIISAGDVIACSILRDPKFIQWNKIHLIATTEQGLIVKRLHKSNKPDCLLAVSDNAEYEPFDIPKSEIAGMARVVGVIHLE